MRTLDFRLVNVFTVQGARLTGNPLCVFLDGGGLSDAELQALARQMNLSETTFLLPPTLPGASARVRIFTPSFELPFAGHPTLGTAQVVRSLRGAGGPVGIEMAVGLVEVRPEERDRFTLRVAREPEVRSPEASREELAAMLGLPPDDLGAAPRWVDTGSEQLLCPLVSADAVRRARPVPSLLDRHGFSARRGASMVYVWAPEAAGEVVARFFFASGGGVAEDPATGSACANLGGWLLAEGVGLPLRLRVHQGAQVARPSLLELTIDAERRIHVGGEVVALGAGSLSI